MATLQDVMTRARQDMTDNHATDAKRRTPDATLLQFVNDGLRETRRLRNDLWVGGYTTPFTDSASTATFPLPEEYVPVVAHYCVFRAERKDDEYVLNKRAETAYALFLDGLGVR